MKQGDLVVIAVYNGRVIPTEDQLTGIVIETYDEPEAPEPRADVLASVGLLKSIPNRWMRVINETG